MARPKFEVNGHDYAKYIAADGLSLSFNDLDADGSGRNILTGLMYRKKIATKQKWTVAFNRLTEAEAAQIISDMNHEYVDVTLLDAKTQSYVTRTYYTSTINAGVQRQIGGKTYYYGMSFDITER